MQNTKKLGVYDLSGPAVDRVWRIADDNHADTADEAVALANFDVFSESFFETQRQFLTNDKLSE